MPTRDGVDYGAPTPVGNGTARVYIEMRNGAPVELSAREFAVLEALMKEPGAVVSREKLEDAVYGWGEEVESNSIEVHLHHLRRKLAPELIRNVRGVGYRIALL